MIGYTQMPTEAEISIPPGWWLFPDTNDSFAFCIDCRTSIWAARGYTHTCPCGQTTITRPAL